MVRVLFQRMSRIFPQELSFLCDGRVPVEALDRARNRLLGESMDTHARSEVLITTDGSFVTFLHFGNGRSAGTCAPWRPMLVTLRLRADRDPNPHRETQTSLRECIPVGGQA